MTTLQSVETRGMDAHGMAVADRRDVWKWVFALGALGNIPNALWMLADPAGWYHGLPAGVPDFGPLNEHFVRDIGSAFLVLGLVLAWGVFVPAVRLPALVTVTLFYVFHALVHVWDTLRGLVGPEHWTIDLGGVYLPAAFMMALTAAYLARQRRST